jgi:hypothetical protein
MSLSDDDAQRGQRQWRETDVPQSLARTDHVLHHHGGPHLLDRCSSSQTQACVSATQKSLFVVSCCKQVLHPVASSEREKLGTWGSPCI